MKKTSAAFLLGLLITLSSGVSALSQDTVTQVSTIDALLAGVYDGCVTYNELLKYGDFGLGTFHRLDGEMVLLDGKVYQIKADGKVYTPSLDITAPFAAISQFRPDVTLPLKEPFDFEKLEAIVDSKMKNENIFCGIKVRGTFSKMKTRSVPPQEKPYLPLVEVTKHQSVFDMTNVTGTIVGFRCPSFVEGINVPGYHLHFISDDRTKGGHILSFEAAEGVVEIDMCNKFFLILPEGKSEFDQIDLKLDRTGELKEVER